MGLAAPAMIAGGSILGGLLSHHGGGGGANPKPRRLTALDHRQKKLLKNLLKHPDRVLPNIQQNPTYQQGSGFLQNLLRQDQGTLNQFSAPYMRQFNEQIMPRIAEQFAGQGALNSSGFQNAAAGAGSSLMERLAALHGELGLQGLGQGLAYAQAPFTNRFNTVSLGLGTHPFGYQGMNPSQPSFLQSIMGPLASAGGLMAMQGMFDGGVKGVPQRTSWMNSGFPT